MDMLLAVGEKIFKDNGDHSNSKGPKGHSLFLMKSKHVFQCRH